MGENKTAEKHIDLRTCLMVFQVKMQRCMQKIRELSQKTNQGDAFSVYKQSTLNLDMKKMKRHN